MTPSISEGGEVGEVGVVTFFVLEVPDYESAMLTLPNLKELTNIGFISGYIQGVSKKQILRFYKMPFY